MNQPPEWVQLVGVLVWSSAMTVALFWQPRWMRRFMARLVDRIGRALGRL